MCCSVFEVRRSGGNQHGMTTFVIRVSGWQALMSLERWPYKEGRDDWKLPGYLVSYESSRSFVLSAAPGLLIRKLLQETCILIPVSKSILWSCGTVICPGLRVRWGVAARYGWIMRN